IAVRRRYTRLALAGEWPSGKAADSGSANQRFESSLPSQSRSVRHDIGLRICCLADPESNVFQRELRALWQRPSPASEQGRAVPYRRLRGRSRLTYRRVNVRWVMPLGELTAPTLKRSSSSWSPSQRPFPRAGTL